eukprot:2122017-Prymnesium_polylepis.2
MRHRACAREEWADGRGVPLALTPHAHLRGQLRRTAHLQRDGPDPRPCETHARQSDPRRRGAAHSLKCDAATAETIRAAPAGLQPACLLGCRRRA